MSRPILHCFVSACLFSWSPPSPELSGRSPWVQGDARDVLSQAVITARQTATLSAHPVQIWTRIDKSHRPRWDLIVQTLPFLAYHLQRHTAKWQKTPSFPHCSSAAQCNCCSREVHESPRNQEKTFLQPIVELRSCWKLLVFTVQL